MVTKIAVDHSEK